MADWENLVLAERISTKRKASNYGVKKHRDDRIRNLVEIQQNIINRNMMTGEYVHELRVSGQDKVRDISKLNFHPSHIQHQLLVMMAEQRIDKAFIRQTYASRIGYGQIKAALQIKKSLRRHKDEYLWFSQCDIRKYYDSIRHDDIRKDVSRFIKDKTFVDAFVEPFEKFSNTGVGIPLGIRPSQITGNLRLMNFDRFAMSEVKCNGYLRYLDDFIFFGKTKGEVKYKTKRLTQYLEKEGFRLHEPKIHRVSNGIDMLGFVYYGTRNDMYWRKSDKKRWLRRRSSVTNPKRIRALDDAAYGMLKWGNKNCKRLFQSVTNRDMGVLFRKSGISLSERRDENGNPFFDAPKISMSVLLGKPVEILRVIRNIKTQYGDNRYFLEIDFMGSRYKLVVNSYAIKSFIDDMLNHHVSRFIVQFCDKGMFRYDVDKDKVEILSVDGRDVELMDGKVVYSDDKSVVTYLQ